MKHKYYYTYKVQCTAVGWEDYYYLGKHVTSNLNDGYKGSGKKLQEYYKQYPEDYTFTILKFYSNKTELNIAEQKLIGDLWKTDPYCLNANTGGHGSWAAAHKIPKTKELKYRLGASMRGKHHTEATKHKISETLKGKGHPHTEETKRIISENTKRSMNNPDIKKRMSESRKGKKNPNKAVNKGKHRVYREDGSYYMSAE